MKYFLFLLFIILLPSFSQPSAGQQLPTYCYNLSIENGMPDNQIYRMITDRFGYLWIGTPKGVVRYNGYEFKTFTMSDGLGNDDVWELYEDGKGRIWLGCIASDFGYLYNNKYYKTILNNSNQSVVPEGIRPRKKEAIYLTSVILGIDYPIYIERHDTMQHCSIRPPHGVDNIIFRNAKKYPLAMPSGYLAIEYLDNLYEGILPSRPGDSLISLRYISKVPKHVTDRTRIETHRLIGNYQLYRPEKTGRISAFNVRTGIYTELDLKNYGISDKINHIYPDSYNAYFYAVCDNVIAKFDTGLNFIRQYKIRDLIHTDEVDGRRMHTVLQNSFWKNCIGTTTHGVYVNNEVINHFRKLPLDLFNYQYIGRLSDSISMWWNSSRKIVAKLKGTSMVAHTYVGYVEHLNTVYKAGMSKSGSLLLTEAGFLSWNRKGVLARHNFIAPLTYDFVQPDTNFFLLATNGGLSTYTSTYHDNETLIDKDRYDHIVSDSLSGEYWAYNKRKIFVYRPNGSHKMISQDSLKRLGMRRIDKIVIDNTYGNIFLKGANSILLYNRENDAFRQLLDYYNLEGALIDIYNNTFIVAGRFGVLFCKITGKGTLTQPVLYSNPRDINYRQAIRLFGFGNHLLLQTDKGNYEMQMPADSILSNAASIKNDQYRFILNYRDTIRSINTDDTLVLDQKSDHKLQFDVINPNGSGRLKYKVKLAENKPWNMLNSNEFTLPSDFKPGHYYTLYVMAQDDAWTTPPIKLKLYIRPYWWQTKWGSRLLWSAAILSFLLLIASSVLITRKLVLKAAQKRSLQMELELKAIYAQINPHFIFNTLNSALLLVSKNKMEDAYTHISKFSRLLRSYIKSSRNKLISISDEIDNLEDYIELQQTRFKNKFSYDIIIDSAIEPSKIRIPALLLQPFVENAINHGILPKEDAGHLKIEFRKDTVANDIFCIVEDDGVGRTPGNAINVTHEYKQIRESYGDLLIKDLVTIFNKYEHMNIAIKYVDKPEPLTGTIVYIQIKNPHHDK